MKYSPDGQSLYIGCDGGFYKVTNPAGILTFTPLNNGLTIGTIQKIGGTNLEDDLMLIGEFDCGSVLYDPLMNPGAPWRTVNGGDGGEQVIDYSNSDIMYTSSQKNAIIRSINRGINFNYSLNKPSDPGCPNELENAEFCADYVMHPYNPNILYVNYTDLYKRTYSGNNGSWLQVSFFDDDFALNCYDPLIAIGVAPNNPQVIYVAIENLHYPNPSDFLLFKTSSGGYDNGCIQDCWTELFPPNLPCPYITSITVSPYDENRIWISYSGYVVGEKVKMFDGNVWSDYSVGLPNMPINNLIFEHGSNNGLFAATDVGVYYINSSMGQWEPFMTNLPNVMVSELEINYQYNNIKAGTYGRGLWKSPLPCTYINSNIEITSDQSWFVPMRVMSNITVKTGKTLTVKNSSTVYLSEYSKIIIERGGKLILDGGTLTSACAGMWKGIEVWGTATTTQNPIDQGWVKIINGGTIKNAVCGIRAVKMSIPQGDGEEAPDYYYTGGIIQASDAHFINNQTAVQFYNYSYNSVSYFVNCEFKLDGNYFGTTEPENYMVVDNMTGVRVTFCEFLNEKTEDAEYTGILSENSTIYLEGDCIAGSPCTAWENGTFENLEYGIYANAATTSRHVDIRHTNFVNNYRGIYIGGMTSPRVTSNKFYLNRPATDHGYGLYLDRSTGYWVEDNLFEKTPGFGGTDPLGIGIVVNESGRNPNQIYLNTFNYVEYAINVQGQNRHGKISSQGLVIKCNDYNETAFDETIIWNAPVGSSEAGIARSQGLGTLNIGDMAGNIFHYQTTATDYDDINNTSNIIDYYYSSNAGDLKVEPMDAQFLVTVWKYGMGTLAQWTPEAACLSAINPGGGGTGTVEYRADMEYAQEGIETTDAVLTAMIDGGDTEALNNEVETSTPPEAIQVYNELMSVSPNLSETVVESSIEKENVLPNAMVRDVMVANPHTSKSLVLLEKLDERFDPMPDYMKAQILAGRSIQTLKQELEEQLAGYQLKKTIAMDNIIRYYQEQLEPQVASDSIVALYQSDHTLNSSYRLAWLYLERGEYQNGESVLNNIPNKFTLDETEQLEYNQIFSIYTMLAGLYENGNTIASLTENQISQLQTLEAEGTLTAQVYARNILLALDEIEYNEPVLFPDFTKSSQAIEEYGKLINTKPPQMLEVYPNPSSGYVIIGYNLEKAEGCKIEISGMTGKTIQTLATSGKQDQITVVTENWKPGTYIATLFIDGKVIESCKFTIIK
ncbi:MAG: T9SS type A sorting domain-containing protein [Bacteroidales bacterium]